jgi:protein ImuB
LPDPTNTDPEKLEQLALWCQQFSPRVAIDRTSGGHPAATLLLEITGLGPHFGGEEQLARLIVRRFAERRLTVRLAVADSIGAAWAVAHFAPAAADAAAAGIHCLPPGGSLIAALGPLPVAALRLAPSEVGLLAALGIDTITQLVALPRDQLAARFGAELLLRLDQATGRCEEVLETIAHRRAVSAEWPLEFPTARLDLLREILRRLIARIAGQLAEQGRVPLGLECRLQLQAGEPLKIPVSLYQASADPAHLIDLVGLHLERITIAEPVCSVRIVVTESVRRESHQLKWFPSFANEETGVVNPFARALGRCLERLGSRLGCAAVARPRLTRDAVPERAVRLASPAGGKRTTRTTRKIGRGTFRLRPLWLEPSPRPLHVTASDRQGRPLQFRYRGDLHQIRLLEGPERIESSWQDRQRARQILRDYYRVETITLRRFWLFRRRPDGRWFLHGEFD